MGKVDEMVEEKIEAPERIWLQLRPYGYGPYWYEKLPSGTESVEYTRSLTNTRQRAERAAEEIFKLFSGMHPSILWNSDKKVLADIIAAEFEK